MRINDNSMKREIFHLTFAFVSGLRKGDIKVKVHAGFKVLRF